MFAEWYPKLAPLKCTYKSKIIPMGHKFVSEYLIKDGMHMPELQDISGMSDGEQTEFRAEVASIRSQIDDSLSSDFTGGCLVKTNWSSTVDAEFISQTLECTTADEVFLQLKASPKTSEDLFEPYDSNFACQTRLTSEDSFAWTLVLRKWHPNHNIGMEFQCFVSDGHLVAVA